MQERAPAEYRDYSVSPARALGMCVRGTHLPRQNLEAILYTYSLLSLARLVFLRTCLVAQPAQLFGFKSEQLWGDTTSADFLSRARGDDKADGLRMSCYFSTFSND